MSKKSRAEKELDEFQPLADHAQDLIWQMDAYKYDSHFISEAEPMLAELLEKKRTFHSKIVKDLAFKIIGLLKDALDVQQIYKSLQ